MASGSDSQGQEDGKMQCDWNCRDEDMHYKANIEEGTTEVMALSLSAGEEVGRTLLSMSSGSDAIEKGLSAIGEESNPRQYVVQIPHALARLRFSNTVAESDVDKALRLMQMSTFSLYSDDRQKSGLVIEFLLVFLEDYSVHNLGIPIRYTLGLLLRYAKPFSSEIKTEKM